MQELAERPDSCGSWTDRSRGSGRFDLITRLAAVTALAAALLVYASAATRAAFDEPVLLAERTIDLERTPKDGLTSEFIDVSGADNRFSAVLLSTVTGTLTVKGLRLTGEDGQTREIVVDSLLRPAAAPIEVPLADSDVTVRRLEVLYRRPPPEVGTSTGSALLQVSGRRLEAPPSGLAENPAPSPPGGTALSGADQAIAARLVKLAGRKIDLSRSEITLDIGQAAGAISVLQIRTPDLPMIVRQIRVTLASGETREIKLGQLIEAGGASRLITIGAAAGAPKQRVRSVTIEVRQRTANETGLIEIWGDRSEDRTAVAPQAPERRPEPPRPDPRVADADAAVGPNDRRPPSGRPVDGQRADERNWKLLGSITDTGEGRSRTRRAVFSIRRVAGSITAVRFLPRRDVVRLFDARVEFADGRRERLDVRGFQLEPGQMTDVLPLRGGDVVSIEVFYRALDAFVGPAVLEVWARVEGPSDGRLQDRPGPGGFGDNRGTRGGALPPDPDD